MLNLLELPKWRHNADLIFFWWKYIYFSSFQDMLYADTEMFQCPLALFYY